jgi:hypothetical protein
MTLSIISDFVLETVYGCNPDVVRKIYEILLLLEPHFGDDSLDIIISCIYDSYITDHRKLYLVADEFYCRISKVPCADRHRQLILLTEQKINLHDINKKRTNITTIPICNCISCGEDTIYNDNNKKYCCTTCDVEYSSL